MAFHLSKHPVKQTALKKEKAEVEHYISMYRKLVREYPNSAAYKETLAKLQQNHADLVDRIGR